MPNYVFKRPTSEYTTHISPVSDYIKQAATYVQAMRRIPYKDAVVLVKKALKTYKLNNPVVKYKSRADNGDRVIKEDKILDYIKDTLDNGEILVPSFTAYDHPSKKKSIHSNFLSTNIAKRKQDKHNQFKYKQAGDKTKANYYNILQKIRKIYNNSLSGAYGSQSTILFNPSAHFTLTSITRCVASIGNAITESIIAGNKHIKSPQILLNYITSIITHVPSCDVERVVIKHNLYRPSVDDVMDALLYSSRNYWEDEVYENNVKKYLEQLSDIQLCTILYVNDLFHIKKYNETFVKDLLSNMSKKIYGHCEDPIGVIKKAPEGIANLANHIWYTELKGLEADYDKLYIKDRVLIENIATSINNITNVMLENKLFFRTFFTTSILPIDIAYIRDMLRDAIVLSDTDSTCGSYDHWVNWYFGADRYSPEAIALSAATMTINTQVMDHNIKLFAKNMNIADEMADLVKMKNEYFWPVFIATNVSKHYFATIWTQEGNVYAEPSLEIKGVHLIASAVDQSTVKLANNMMEEILKIISSGDKISLKKYVTQVADVERDILSRIKTGDLELYRREKIKEKDSYKKDEEDSPYFHHLLWEASFGKKYGSAGMPEYNVIRIPTTLKTKNMFNAYLESIEDKELSNDIKNHMDKNGKDTLGTFRIPITIVATSGIPEEIKLVIDEKRIVTDICNILYMLLESIGFYRKEFMLVSEMGY